MGTSRLAQDRHKRPCLILNSAFWLRMKSERYYVNSLGKPDFINNYLPDGSR